MAKFNLLGIFRKKGKKTRKKSPDKEKEEKIKNRLRALGYI